MKDAKHIGAYACAMDCGGRTFRRHFAIKHIFIQIAPDLAAGSERCRPGQVTFLQHCRASGHIVCVRLAIPTPDT